ncbi:accessory Sec system glycosylation chaperone GtfB [Streptococcus merionis]|uniref:accessory Sec system glycosylation chaperone GtfB n=1 Tax=Streptococcus merionis TaxID=400065 RepID=UPI0026EEE70E|nr:accessory Sec system glycosylation chaperone GtfB [Streptococcus merionis]
MINLFDWFDQKAQDLYYSLEVSGYNHPTVVVHEDGFLPKDVISPVQFFSAWDKSETGRPRFFNEIEIPKYYRISGSNTQAAIYNLEKKVANIYYAAPAHRRFVKAVDWLDERGVVRLTEHYNQYGWRFAQTNLNRDQQAVLRTYFDQSGREILVENFVTGDITLNWKNELKLFKNQSEFIHFYFTEVGLDVSAIWYNSLSTSFLTSHYLGGQGDDVLFWQEDVGDSIPGNMQLILDGGSPRTKKILVQDELAYQKLVTLLSDEEQQMVARLGYVYPSLRPNAHRREALILTNSDHIEALDMLVDTVKDLHFHIGALTEMSNKLMAFSQKANVSLYPNISAQLIDQLFESCDIYLDINHEAEIVSAVRRAFEHNQVIFAFSNTCHSHQFVAKEHIYAPDDAPNLARKLQDLSGQFDQAVAAQRLESSSASPEDYQRVL